MKVAATPSSLQRLIDLYDDLVDPHVGIVQTVEEVPREIGSPDFHHFAGRACNTAAFSRHANFRNTGGASVNRDIALAKAIGEAVERYCSALYEIEELPLVSYEDAPFPCVAPDSFALYSPEQYERPGFPWTPFDESTPVRWTPALDLATGQPCHVPAAMVYVPYFFYQGTGDAPIVQPISTGLACHSSPAEAAISGICEAVERDAFTITWQAMISAPQLRVETLSDENYNLVERFESTGSSVVVLNITMDVGIPTFLSVLRSTAPEAPALVFAAATDLDPEKAVRKSLEELAHTRRYSQQIKARMPRMVPDPEHTNVKDQIAHLNFWTDQANAPLADFIFASPVRQDFSRIENRATGDPQRDLQILVEMVQAVNHRVLIADVSTPDIEALGLTVVRAVIPGFHPLFMGFGIRGLGGTRLWEVPQKLGYKGIARETGDNPEPHPYP